MELLTLIAKADELIELNNEIERLEKENEYLKKKIERYESIGMKEVIEAMSKAQIMEEFIEKLQSLICRYAERVNE